MRYVYLGDRMTAERWRGQLCDPVRRADGKCIVGGSKQLVRFADGSRVTVNRRRLRVRAVSLTNESLNPPTIQRGEVDG